MWLHFFNVSVLHHNKGGIGKSIPDAQEISRDPRPEYGHSIHHQGVHGIILPCRQGGIDSVLNPILPNDDRMFGACDPKEASEQIQVKTETTLIKEYQTDLSNLFDCLSWLMLATVLLSETIGNTGSYSCFSRKTIKQSGSKSNDFISRNNLHIYISLAVSFLDAFSLSPS